MSSLGSLNIHLSLETAQFQQGLSKSTAQAQHFAKTFVVDMDKAQRSARQFADRTTSYLGNIEKAANNINKAAKWDFRFDNIERVKSAAKEFIKLADAHTELSNKLKLVSENELQHAQAMSAVYDISIKTAQSTQAVSAVYQSFAQNAKELGINQRQVADVTETISKAVAISGASTAEAQNALTQFGQVLLMGKFRAQEYNSVMTQTPAVMQAIARGLGVTMAELKAMSDDGKLTTDKIIQGLERSKKSVDELYGKTTTTISGAMQNLSTATEKWVGELNSSLAVSDKVVSVIQAVTNHLDILSKGIVVVGAAYTGLKLGAVVQGRYNHIKAIQAETTATYEKLASSAKEAQTTYQAQLAIYQNIQAKQADVVATQAQVQAEQAKLRILALSATSYAERRLIQTELQALDRVSAELTQKQIFLEQQQIAAKQALNVAYRENAVAQSAFVVSTKASGVAMTAFRTISAGVTAEINALKAAMLSNPIMLGLTAVMTAVSMIGLFANSTNEATEASLRYADSIDQVKTNLDLMTKSQVAAELVKTKQSIEEQEKAVAKLRLEQKGLINDVKDAKGALYDGFGGYVEVPKTAKEIADAQDKLTLKTAELEEAQSKLNKTLEWQKELKAHEPLSELKEKIAALYPEINSAQIKVDGLNISIGNFTMTLPQANSGVVDYAKALLLLSSDATKAAIAVANLNKAQSGLSDDALKFIENNKKQAEIARLRKAGKDKEANKRQAELNVSNKGFTGADYDAALKSEIELLNTRQPTKSGIKTKSGEDYRNDWDKYYDDLVNANATAWEKIRYEQEVAARELDKHLSHGVVSQAEAEKARALIAEQYSKQRRELAGQYAPEIAAQEQLKQQLRDITQLRENETLTAIQAIKAREKAQYDYAQNVAQNAVNPLAQFNAQFDPYQEIENQRTRDLALLDAMQESNGQKLLAEEDYQQKRQQIIDKYDLERQKKEADYYTQSTQMMSSAFDTMAGVMANAAGQQSAAYKAMFAISKAFAIAEASIKLSQAISQAMADPTALTPVQKFANMAAIASAGANLVSQITSIGFSDGGYTGDGGKYTPAGIVHKGEYVITKEATARLGKGYLDYLNYGKRGFANGGGVAVPTLPTMRYQPSNAGTGRISVNVINNGEPMEANVSQKERNGQMEITVELVRQIAQREAGTMIQQNMRPGGMFAR